MSIGCGLTPASGRMVDAGRSVSGLAQQAVAVRLAIQEAAGDAEKRRQARWVDSLSWAVPVGAQTLVPRPVVLA
jgi:hypothetical protein